MLVTKWFSEARPENSCFQEEEMRALARATAMESVDACVFNGMEWNVELA